MLAINFSIQGLSAQGVFDREAALNHEGLTRVLLPFCCPPNTAKLRRGGTQWPLALVEAGSHTAPVTSHFARASCFVFLYIEPYESFGSSQVPGFYQ